MSDRPNPKLAPRGGAGGATAAPPSVVCPGVSTLRPRTLLCLLVVAGAAARPAAQQLPLQLYPPEALPQVSIQCIVQDSTGYLWIGTQDGVARYDGDRFVPFGADQGLRGALIREILQDSNSRLWVATGQGLSLLQGDRFVTYGPEDGLTGEHVLTIAEGQAGELYAGTGIPAGVTRVTFAGDRAGPTLHEVDIGPAAGIYNIEDLAIGTDGELFVATNDAGLRVVLPDGQVLVLDSASGFPGERAGPLIVDTTGCLYAGGSRGLVRYRQGELFVWQERHGLPVTSVESLALGSAGELYAGTGSGEIYCIDAPAADRPGRVRTIASGIGDSIAALLVDSRGLLWAAASGSGLLRYDPQRQELWIIDDDHGLQGSTVVVCLQEDREGNLWIGSNGGLYKTRSPAFVNYLRQDGLAHNHAWCVRRMGEQLLVGTSQGLSILDDGAWLTVSTADGLAGDEIRAITVTGDGTLLVGGIAGLTRVEGTTHPPHGPAAPSAPSLPHPGRFAGDRQVRCTVYDRSSGLPHERINCLSTDQTGHAWIGTWEGLALMKDGRPVPLPEVGRMSIWAIVHDQEGRTWVGGDSALLLLDGDGTLIRRFTTGDGLLDNFALSLAVDGQGGLWISYGAASVGVSRLRYSHGGSPELRHFTVHDGLPSNRVFFVGHDRQDRVWLGTSKGIAALDLAGGDGSQGHHVRVFTTDHGLPWNDCSHNGFFADDDGTLWFGTGKGLSHYRPELDQAAGPPPVVLTGVTLGGAPAASGARVSYARRHLHATFTALSYVAERTTTFRYRLLGFRDDWSRFQQARSATFTNLPPGRYELQVEARSSGGVRSISPAVFRCQVLPPWWRTWWFQTLILAAVGLAVLSAHRLRTRHIVRRNLELEELVESRTRRLAEHSHELEQANLRIKEADRMKSRFLARMSHELRTPLNSIIGFSDVLLSRLAAMPADRQRGFLQNINDSGRHLLALINNILDLSKIEAGKMELQVEEISIEKIVEGVRQAMSGIAEKRGIEIAVTLPEKPPVVQVDGTKVKEILFNLLSNAVKFSPDRSTVTVTVRVVPGADSPLAVDSLELEVQDLGIGIPSHELPRIFEEFRQVDGATSSQERGTGLGLALTRKLTELQGGQITVQSATGEGSTFQVLLPSVVSES